MQRSDDESTAKRKSDTEDLSKDDLYENIKKSEEYVDFKNKTELFS